MKINRYMFRREQRIDLYANDEEDARTQLRRLVGPDEPDFALDDVEEIDS